jgi:adenylyl- and sulfurtransferase ThiI
MILILRPGEVFLKSERVRQRWEECLLRNIREVLEGIEFSITRERGRIYLKTSSVVAPRRLQWVPGITSISPAVQTEAKPDLIVAEAVKLARRHLRSGMTFAVRAKCVNQPFSGRWLEEEIGRHVLSSVQGIRVDLSSPSLTLEVEVRGEMAYLFWRRVEGMGGLPAGTEGSVSPLCTGKPEEVIAAWYMLKRGCSVHPIILSSRAERVTAQLKKLHQPMWGFSVSVDVRSWRELALGMKTAGELGKKVGARAVVRGDWLEELLPELFELDGLCPLPVLRPLVGMHREALEEVASRLHLPRPLPSALPPRQPLESVEEVGELVKRAERVYIKPWG